MSDVWVGLIGVGFSGLVYAVAATAYVMSRFTEGSNKTNLLEARLIDKINDTREFTRLIVEAQIEKEAKARHDLAGNFAASQLETQREVRSLDREAVRKVDLNASEERIMGAINKIEKRVEELSYNFIEHRTREGDNT